MPTTTAHERVRNWATAALAAASPGARLPPDRAVARSLGVSQRTVASALRAMAVEGAIVRIHGSGSFAPGQSAGPPLESPGAAARLRAEIQSAINRGVFQIAHPLPLLKYLAKRYRVSPRTVSAALAILHSDGAIVRAGRRSWVGSIERAGRIEGAADVTVVTRSREEARTLFSSGPYALAYRHAESLLSGAGLRVSVVTQDELAGCGRAWARGKQSPYGLIVARADVTVMREVVTQTGGLRRRGSMPPMVVDWDAPASDTVPGNARLLTRSSMSTTLARTLAHFAASRAGAYRRVVVFLRADDPHDLRNSCLWSAGTALRLDAELRYAEPSITCHLVFLGKVARPYRASLESIVEPSIATRLLSKYAHTDVAAMAGHVAFEPELERALRTSGRSTLLAFRDTLQAQAARDWCAARGVRVPGDVGIIALDSDPRTYHLGISRCEPDWERTGFVIAHALIGDVDLERTRRGFLRQGARVVEKATT
jgi:DNA-binding transcriptional regulator YhcF (GntR family)